MDKLTITSNCETITVFIDKKSHPNAFKRAVTNLMESGMTENEAEYHITVYGFEMEVFYQENCGLFMVESGAVDSIDIYDPYNGDLIPKIED